MIDYEIFEEDEPKEEGGDDADDEDSEEEVGLLSLVGAILKNEGISGFYGGIKAMMIGQALIKSVAFSANAFALGDQFGGIS